MSEEEIQKWKNKIDEMSQIDMARLLRFAPSGHPCFDNRLPIWEYFQERFNKMGGLTPEISKEISW